METQFSPKNNPRVIIIQKLYSKIYNNDEKLIFPKHRFKKFIKDVVYGTLERDEIINDEIKKFLGQDNKSQSFDKIFLTIIKCAVFEFFYKNKTSKKIIIKEYLNASNFFLEENQTKYLNAILDKLAKNIREINGWNKSNK